MVVGFGLRIEPLLAGTRRDFAALVPLHQVDFQGPLA
jgi:hypothetical protein